MPAKKKKNPADIGSQKLQLNKPPHFNEKRWHSEKSAFYITNSCHHKLNCLKNSIRFFLIIKSKHISCLKLKDLIKSTIITLFFVNSIKFKQTQVYCLLKVLNCIFRTLKHRLKRKEKKELKHFKSINDKGPSKESLRHRFHWNAEQDLFLYTTNTDKKFYTHTSVEVYNKWTWYIVICILYWQVEC